MLINRIKGGKKMIGPRGEFSLEVEVIGPGQTGGRMEYRKQLFGDEL